MSELIVECPSGLVGRVRGVKGKDFRTFTSNEQALSGASLTQLISTCWLETTSYGLYAPERPFWDDALQGDRFYALLRIRHATYPNEPYSFKVPCQVGGKRCRKITVDLDLNTLAIKPLPDASAAQFREKNRFETTLSDGRVVAFKLSTGHDAKRQKEIIDKIGPTARGIPLALASRILSFGGSEKPSVRDIFEFLDDLELAEHRNLLERFDAADCGVDTDVPFTCPWCDEAQKISLPFGQSFFLPPSQTSPVG
jgi:hypothetical protein